MKIDVLNPNDPKVYTDPQKVRLLSPEQQMVAIINLAKTGQIVRGNEVLTLEAILRDAGYQANMDGQLSAEEVAAMEHFKEQLEDKHFKEAAVTLSEMVLGAASAAAVVDLITPDAPTAGLSPQSGPAQRAAAKVLKNLFDPE
jgi:hypothetical protein